MPIRTRRPTQEEQEIMNGGRGRVHIRNDPPTHDPPEEGDLLASDGQLHNTNQNQWYFHNEASATPDTPDTVEETHEEGAPAIMEGRGNTMTRRNFPGQLRVTGEGAIPNPFSRPPHPAQELDEDESMYTASQGEDTETQPEEPTQTEEESAINAPNPGISINKQWEEDFFRVVKYRRREGLGEEFDPAEHKPPVSLDYRLFISTLNYKNIIKQPPEIKARKERQTKLEHKAVKQHAKELGVDTFTCCYCQREKLLTPQEAKKTHNGLYACKHCIDGYFSCCEVCGLYFFAPTADNPTIFTGNNGGAYRLCPTCLKKKVTSCSLCNAFMIAEFQKVNPLKSFKKYDKRIFETGLIKKEQNICTSCFRANFTLCTHCKKLIMLNHSYASREYGHFCTTCYEKLFETCCICGSAVSKMDASIHQKISKDFYVCNECYQRQFAPVKRYNFLPNLKFAHTTADKGNTLNFGIELEIENNTGENNNNHIAERVAELYPITYCMHDGSLDNGFEIATHPFSWQWFKENKSMFKKLLLYCKKSGYTSYTPGSCGIHVHMSKKAFTTCHLYKFIKIFYEGKNFKFIKLVSQRDEKSCGGGCQWGSRVELQLSDVEYIVKRKAHKKSDLGKYTAVNTGNRDTLEVRIFRGTLNLNSFLKNIEFCKCLYSFSRDNAFSDVTVKKFVEYLVKHGKTYKHLYNFLVEKRFLTGKKIKFNRYKTPITQEEV